MLFYRWQKKMIMDKAKEGDGGGAGAPPPDNSGDLASLKAANDALMKRLEALEGKGNPPPKKEDEDDTLAGKAAKDRIKKESDASNQKRLESAIKFTMSGAEWAKTNQSMLPKSIEGIFVQAEKENYGNAIEKDSAIKAGIISEFFALQANLDLLTESQKIALADFKALTKNDKQERAHEFYNNIFEPTFESLKRIEKAKQLNKGFGSQSDADSNYKNKLLEKSSKKYLGEKKNA